jgi:hypothetical protein
MNGAEPYLPLVPDYATDPEVKARRSRAAFLIVLVDDSATRISARNLEVWDS